VLFSWAIWQRGQASPLEAIVRMQLKQFQTVDDEPLLTAVQVTNPALVESLSARELEVLRLIAEGLSNAEIAQKLFLTVGTVKVHSRNIYGKLGANNRTQAVAQAQKLNLL
jgi:ATP/maltotriose-dependent transcriptional regulator MalT